MKRLKFSNIFTIGCRFKKSFFIILSILTIIFSLGISRLTIDTDINTLHQKHSTAYKEYHSIQVNFKSPKTILLLASSKNKSLFNRDYLNNLLQLEKNIHAVPHIEKVTSIVSVKMPRINNGALELTTLIPDTYIKSNRIKKIKSIYKKNSPIFNSFLSKNKNSSIIAVEYKLPNHRPKTKAKFFNKIELMIKNNSALFKRLDMFSLSHAIHTQNMIVFRDIIRLVPIATLITIGMIAFFVRSFSAIFIPAITSLTSLVCSIGIIGFLGIPCGIMFVSVPVIIIIVAATEDIHILCNFLENYKHNNKEESIKKTIDHLYFSIILTTLTTTLGFATFAFSKSESIHNFGLSTSIALITNGLLTLFLVPALLHLFSFKKNTLTKIKSNPTTSIVNRIAKYTTRYANAIIVCFLTALALSTCLLPKLKFNLSTEYMLAKSHPISKSRIFIEKNFPGTRSLLIRISSKHENEFTKINNLKKLNTLKKTLLKNNLTFNVTTLADLVSTLHLAISNKKTSRILLPESDNASIQLLSLVDEAKYLPLVNEYFDQTLIHIRFKYSTQQATLKYISWARKMAHTTFPNQTISVSSIDKLFHHTSTIMRSEFGISILLCTLTVMLLFIFQYQSFRIALIAIFTNIFPIIFILGLYSLLNIPINFGAIVALVIIICIAVDDTIHFFTKYSQNCRKYNDRYNSMLQTLQCEFKPITSTSLAISLGFLCMAFTPLTDIKMLSITTALGIFLAVICDIILNPALAYKVSFVNLLDLLLNDYDISLIQSCALFKYLSKKQIKRVFLMNHNISIPENTQIIKKGVDSNKLYFLLEGELEVESGGTLITLKPGSIIGEMSFFSSSKTTANVYAKVNSKLVSFDEKTLRKNLQFHKNIFIRLQQNAISIILKRLLPKSN